MQYDNVWFLNRHFGKRRRGMKWGEQNGCYIFTLQAGDGYGEEEDDDDDDEVLTVMRKKGNEQDALHSSAYVVFLWGMYLSWWSLYSFSSGASLHDYYMYFIREFCVRG